jgi:hypothetical protein
MCLWDDSKQQLPWFSVAELVTKLARLDVALERRHDNTYDACGASARVLRAFIVIQSRGRIPRID